jgi:hypothetical protein
MKASADDIAALKRMASTFERELASLGVDVEAMKKGLADLANRVSALEKHKFPADIHGTLDLLTYAGYSSDDRFGITKEGRPTGVHKGDDDTPTGNHDWNFWGEGSVLLETTNEDGPKGRIRFAAGNTMAQGIDVGLRGLHAVDLSLQSGQSIFQCLEFGARNFAAAAAAASLKLAKPLLD